MKSAGFWFLLASLFAATALRADPVWVTNLEAAKAEAKSSGKKLILDFTGSDWCSFCKKLDAEVLSTPQFAAFAEGYVLVRLDYPRKKPLPAAERVQNEKLKDKFKIEGYPTLILTDASGHELSRAVGYEPGSGPKAYLAELSGEHAK